MRISDTSRVSTQKSCVLVNQFNHLVLASEKHRIYGDKQPDDVVGVKLASHNKTHSRKMLLSTSTIMPLLPHLVTKPISSLYFSCNFYFVINNE